MKQLGGAPGFVALLLGIGALVCVSAVAEAGPDGVTVSLSTDRDTYSLGALSMVPIVVNMYVENNTDQWLVVTEDKRKLNSYAQFGGLRLEPAHKVFQPSPCGTCTAVKGLAFKAAPLPAYQNVATDHRANYFLKRMGDQNVSLLGIYLGPHERKLVARAEVYLNEFLTPPVAGVYQIRGNIYPGSIWNWLTQEEAASETGVGYEAVAFVKLR